MAQHEREQQELKKATGIEKQGARKRKIREWERAWLCMWLQGRTLGNAEAGKAEVHILIRNKQLSLYLQAFYPSLKAYALEMLLKQITFQPCVMNVSVLEFHLDIPFLISQLIMLTERLEQIL